MQAEIYDLRVQQGSDYSIRFTFNNSSGVAIDLTSHSFRSQIRQRYDSQAILATFTVSSALGTDKNQVLLTLTDTQTAVLTVSKSKTVKKTEEEYCWDLEWTDDSGVVRRPLEGTVFVSPRVTQ